MIDAIVAAQNIIINEIKMTIKETEYAKQTDKIDSWMRKLKDGYRLISSGDT